MVLPVQPLSRFVEFILTAKWKLILKKKKNCVNAIRNFLFFFGRFAEAVIFVVGFSWLPPNLLVKFNIEEIFFLYAHIRSHKHTHIQLHRKTRSEHAHNDKTQID